MRVSIAVISSSVGVCGVASSLWIALTLGALCDFSSRAPLVEDTAFSGWKLLYPIYIGASTISTNIGTIP